MTANLQHGRSDTASRFIAAPADVIYRAFVDPAV
jgi:hypothetical protein